MAPTPSSAGDLVASPSKSGCGRRSSPWAASRCAQPWTPCLVVHDAAADPRARAWWPCQPPPTQAVQLPPSRYHSQAHWYLHHPSRSSQEFTRELFFSYPTGRFFAHIGPAALSQPPQKQYPQGQLKLPLRINLWPRSLFYRGQCSGGSLVEAAYTPVSTASSSMATIPCTPAQLYIVYSPCI